MYKSRHSKRFIIQFNNCTIFKIWLLKYPKPQSIFTDQGRQYIFSEFEKFLNKNNIQRLITSSYNPTCNSTSERLNRTLVRILRYYLTISIKVAILRIGKSLQRSYHRVLGKIPYEIIFKYSIYDRILRDS